MKKLYTAILFFIFLGSAFGQQNRKELPELNAGEKVFVDYTSSLVFPGEYLYYKVYLLDEATKGLSNLSKIAYVKMINEEGKSVFTHKINTNNGSGNGDFFVPTNIASGTYKLIAFTNWMFNKNPTNYFSATIFVINPYTTKRNNSLERIAKIDSTTRENIDEKGADASILSLSKNGSFSKREQVTVSLDTTKIAEGNYSLSVAKKTNFQSLGKTTISNFEESYISSSLNENISEEKYLPELRGDLFRGKISTPNENLSVNNRSLTVSVPTENFKLKISNTNEEGDFYFNIEPQQSVDELFIQVLGERAEEFNVSLDSLPKFDYSALDFPALEINSAMKDEILNRSIQNQVENSYYSIKPDTLKLMDREVPFFGSKNIEVFPLDDYTRFPTVKETFIEVITSAKIRKNKNDKSVFGVYAKNSDITFNSSALLLVDGLYIENTEALMNYSATKIDRIEVVRDEYYYGSKIFGGVISIETKEKDFVENYQSVSLNKFDIIPVQTPKNYYKVDYENQDLGRIPDFRRQLLWQPNLSDFEPIQFYTSDVAGVFMITLQGIDKNGNRVFDIKEFEVK